MVSPAQNKAVAAYRKRAIDTLTVRFGDNDRWLYAYARSCPNVAGYIKGLIAADIEENNPSFREWFEREIGTSKEATAEWIDAQIAYEVIDLPKLKD